LRDALFRRVERVLELPLSGEEALVLLLQDLGAGRVLGVDALDQVEEEEIRELFGVVDRVGLKLGWSVVDTNEVISETQ
jgi:uncharacterized protein YunC (DUF1805 family)